MLHPYQILKPLLDIFTAELDIGSVSLSLSSVLTVVLLMLGVIFFCRFLSNWLKQGLLIRLGFDEGTREAIATITAYLTGVLGFLVVLQTAGINLSSLSFLAGGLGIGLGFGFQDLAKNFVSGLTLLIERPIKVGDYIKLENIEGTVKRIAIRSTIIMTNKGVTVIVPNLDFLMYRIINCSYQSPVCQIDIPVRVAYGSDPIIVTEILLAAAYRESRVLSDPIPEVEFVKFGENSLEFELQVSIDRPQEKEPIISFLNFIIEYELRQRGISIPLPQRELWLKNPEELGAMLQKTAASQTPSNVSEIEGDGKSESKTTITQPKPLYLRDLLRQVSYFENFTDLDLLQLIEQGYRQTFPREKTIFSEKEPGDSFYIILSGSVDVFADRANKHLRTLYPGDFFGELSLLMGIPRSATVRTLEETILFVVNHKGLQKLLKNHQGLANQIAEKLAERQQELAQRQQSLKDLGLVDEADLDESPLVWVSKRLQTLFGI